MINRGYSASDGGWEEAEGRAYRRRDLRLLQAFGAQAAVAIENASCYYDAQVRRNLEHLAAAGLEIEPFGGRSFQLSALPVFPADRYR